MFFKSKPQEFIEHIDKCAGITYNHVYDSDGEVEKVSYTGALGGAIFPGINAALANGLSFSVPSLMNFGGALGVGMVEVTVSSSVVSSVVVSGAVAVGALGSIVLFARIGNSGGYRIDHHYPNDHDPKHVHISGDDGVTRVDINGNPIQGDRPMTQGEKKAFKRLLDKIIEALAPWL